MQTQLRQIVLAATAASVGLTGLTGCSSLNKADQGTLIGVATGGAVGAVVGNQTGSTARGAIIGAAIGGVAGTIIGSRMERQARELEQKIPGAIVEQVGEGIQVTFASGLLYDHDSYTVKPTARENLRTLATSLQQNPGTEVLIVGHTDDTGADSYNQRLSEQRAQAAADYLAAQGVARTRIRTMGLGESEPKVAGTSAEARAQNRRVEVAIFAGEQLKAEARRQAGS